MQVMIRDISQVYLQTYWCFYGVIMTLDFPPKATNKTTPDKEVSYFSLKQFTYSYHMMTYIYFSYLFRNQHYSCL